MRPPVAPPPLPLRAARPGRVRVLVALLTTLLGAAAGCTAGGDADLPGGPTLGAAAATAAPCTDGDTRACHLPLAVQGRVVTCYDGVERCTEGSWGPCADGEVSAFELPAEAAGLGARAVTDTQECAGNVCDPNCRAFYEAPEVAIETPPGDAIYDWSAGTIADLRAQGLIKKAFEEPCSSGFDCQFNHHCVDPVTHSACAHSKCETGAPLDRHCEDGFLDPFSKNQETCVSMICDADSTCCSRSYDTKTLCPRDPCLTGVPLKSDCDLCVTSVCAALPKCCGVPVGGADPVVREAESFDATYARSAQEWTLIADANASDGQAMISGPDLAKVWPSNKTNKSPSLTFTVNFATAGVWYVWVRGRAGGLTLDTSDTVHVGLDDNIPASAEIIGPATSTVDYVWLNKNGSGTVATINVGSVGVHEVDVFEHEDGFVVDKILLTRSAAYAPIGLGPAGGGGGIGVWDADCVDKYASVCHVDCHGGAWDEGCVDLVDPVCNATCGTPLEATCAHSPCDTSGAPLDANCHPCVQEICRISPTCCITGWSAACADLVASACDLTCPTTLTVPPPQEGHCEAWLPGEVDPTCDGVDLAIGLPCEGNVPICNHGKADASGPIRIIHFPAVSSHYTSRDPDQSSTSLWEECILDEDVPSGECVDLDVVSDTCDFGQNRSVMVNPPKYVATDPELDECGRTDNWAVYRDDLECEPPVCAEQNTTSSFRKVHLYMVVDKSGSMNAARWEGVKSALKTFFGAPEADTLNVALEFFPLDDSVPAHGDGCGDPSVGECINAPCSRPMVSEGELTVALADAQEARLGAALDAIVPGGQTSTFPALRGAMDAMKSARASAPDDIFAVVLTTDGVPTACEASTGELAKIALDGYVNAGVLTYTIGMPSADIAALDRIAFAGGTRTAFVVEDDTAVADDLLNALFAISRTLASCSFTISGGPNVDPKNAEVMYFPDPTSAPVTLTKVSGLSACGEGWYFDDPNDPTSAMLCPATCSTVQNNPNAAVDIRVDCAPLYEGDTFTASYQASCPENMAPQWSLFTWDTDIDPGATVAFRVRAATTEAELPAAPWVELGTATELLQVCGLGGPLDQGCPRNLYDALGAAAVLPVLELEAALEPSSDGIGGAVLNTWEMTFTCVDSF